MVIYLTGDGTGKTRFLNDSQADKDVTIRDLSDWNRSPNEDEIALSVAPESGSALIFNHRILHDSEPTSNNTKIIIRTDIIFQRAN
jgi:hypothetical protein